MKKLRTILQSKKFYIILVGFILMYVLIFTKFIYYESKLAGKIFEGIITKIDYEADKISFVLNSKEKIICNYYIKDYNYDDYKNLLGKKVQVTGKLKEALNNTIPNTFNYKKYLYNKKIYYILTVNNIKILKEENIFYSLKNKLLNKMNNYNNKIHIYLNLLILGDNTYLNDDMYNIYRENGIWHLFAISGTHISLIILVLDYLLKKLKFKNILISLVLFYFMFLTNFSASILRATIFYYIKCLLDWCGVKIDSKKVLILTMFIILIINPFMIYDIGFRYSFLISYAIMHESQKITGNYFTKILKISIISFLVSIPITVNINYELNLLSIFLNVIYVPFITFLVFPMCIITLLMPCLSSLLEILISILEASNNLFNVFSLNIIIPKMSILLILIYYIILFLYSKNYSKKNLFMILILLVANQISPKLDSNYYVYYLDVGQGDSAVLISPYKSEVIMIDTGGSITSDYHISNNTIQFLKSLGITKIDLLILSHGDADHAKETLNLLENYQIKNIILNNGSYNDLEYKIINKGNVVKNYNSKYFNYVNISDYYNNDENYSSMISYFKINNYNLLFMGDSPVEVENKLLNDYKLECDFLKLGHHGSSTSSSRQFLNNFNLEYAIISSGRNNMYNHPSSKVINTLNELNINYLNTQTSGTIELKIKNNDYKIITYKP